MYKVRKIKKKVFHVKIRNYKTTSKFGQILDTIEKETHNLSF